MANGGIIGPVNTTVKKKKPKVSIFTASGTLTTDSDTTKVNATIIAGGGAGAGDSGGAQGGNRGNAGGGAGGLRSVSGQAVCGSTPYTVTIGAGGSGDFNKGTDGSDSTIGASPEPINISATGGGAGASAGATGCGPANPGGSGGGGAAAGSPNAPVPLTTQNPGTGVPVHGYAGGSATNACSTNPLNDGVGAGGGGAGGAGGNATSQPGGSGGTGGAGACTPSILSNFGGATNTTNSFAPGGTAPKIAGGGGGAGAIPAGGTATGGGGAGGAGPSNPGESGTSTSGGGGGGAMTVQSSGCESGGSGGSGVVAVEEITTTGPGATGVFSMGEVFDARLNDTWPSSTFGNINILTIGGGAGAASNRGGGGGAGGYRFNTALELGNGNDYNVTVGAGGVAVPNGPDAPGFTNSTNTGKGTASEFSGKDLSNFKDAGGGNGGVGGF